jgi:hypothetical protein
MMVGIANKSSSQPQLGSINGTLVNTRASNKGMDWRFDSLTQSLAAIFSCILAGSLRDIGRN